MSDLYWHNMQDTLMIILYVCLWYVPAFIAATFYDAIRAYRLDKKYNADPIFIVTKANLIFGAILGFLGPFTLTVLLMFCIGFGFICLVDRQIALENRERDEAKRKRKEQQLRSQEKK